MSDTDDAAAASALGSLAAFAAALAAAIALSVIAGWTFGVGALKSLVPGAVEMKANTAFGLLLAAVSLLLQGVRSSPAASRLGQVLGLLVALLGLATLSEYVFAWKLPLDELVFRDAVEASALSGRMSPYAAAAFGGLGTALVCLPWRALRPLVCIVAASVILIGALSATGYAWRATELANDHELPPVAVNTAAAFILLGVGTLVASFRRSGYSSLLSASSSAPLERRVLGGFIAALALMFVGASFTYRAGANLPHGSDSLVRSQQLRQAARHVYATLSDAESAQRGYLLTGREELRQRFVRRSKQLDQLTSTLARQARDTPRQKAVEALTGLVAHRQRALDEQARVFERDGAQAAQGAVARDAGGEVMQSILAASEAIARTEEQWLADREADTVRSRLLTLLSLVLTVVLATGVLLVLFRGIRREMAARARSEYALHDANRCLDAIVDNIPDMVFVKDAQTLKFVRFNRAAEEVLGRTRDELVGKTDHDLFPKDIADGFAAQDRAIVATGIPHDIAEEKVATKLRGERILRTRKIVIRGDDGGARYLLGISEDITERARQDAQIRELAAALAQRASEVEALTKELEGFSYSVSHDLRAPLRHINGYVELLTSAMGGNLEPEPRRYLSIIAQASQQMGELIENLLAFSRMTRADMHNTQVDLRSTVDAAIAGMEMAIRGRNIDWRIGDLPTVDGDRAMLKIVYAHLLGNAVKYTAPRDAARIEIGASGEEAGRPILFVRDNGVGFDMKYAGKLFGIFQRMHHADEFEGIGIGLATVQRIVTRHGGRVWAEAAAGEGATFYFTLQQAGTGA